MTSQRSVTLSKAALTTLSIKSIELDVRNSELADAIIQNTDWQDSLTSLKDVILETRKRKREGLDTAKD